MSSFRNWLNLAHPAAILFDSSYSWKLWKDSCLPKYFGALVFVQDFNACVVQLDVRYGSLHPPTDVGNILGLVGV